MKNNFNGVLSVSLYHYCKGEKASLELVIGSMFTVCKFSGTT